MTLKIAIFTCEYAPYPGGIASYTREIARAALQLGHTPVVHSFVRQESSPPDDGFEVRQLRPDTYSHIKLPQIAYECSKALRGRNFDLVLAADLQTLIAISYVPSSATKRCVVHGTDVRSRLLTKLSAAPFFKPLRSYNKILSNSEFTRSELIKNHRYINRDNVQVALLGVDEYWRSSPERGAVEGLHSAFGDLTERTVAVSVGRLEPRKGHDQAIEAIKQLPDGLKSRLTYLIVGREVDKAYSRKIQDLISLSGADIRMTGPLASETIRALYHTSEVLLHTATKDPFRIEGFGLVVLEAAAGGLPVIATNVDALSEVVAVGKTGYLCEDKDIAGISAQIARIIERKERKDCVSRDCIEFSKQFSWKSCAEKAFL